MSEVHMITENMAVEFCENFKKSMVDAINSGSEVSVKTDIEYEAVDPDEYGKPTDYALNGWTVTIKAQGRL